MGSPSVAARSWIRVPVFGVVLVKVGSHSCLEYPMPPVELRVSVQVLEGSSLLRVVPVWFLRFRPVRL